jgi:hypothetical protein
MSWHWDWGFCVKRRGPISKNFNPYKILHFAWHMIQAYYIGCEFKYICKKFAHDSNFKLKIVGVFDA